MSSARPLPLRTTPTGIQPLTRVGIAAVALLLTLTIYVIGMSVDHADAPLLLLAVPLALASIAYGLRGGIGMGILASLVVAAWWVAERQYGGVAWLSSRAITCLFIGTVLGWFAESRQQLTRAIAHHRELSLDLIATANVFRRGHRIRVEISSSNFPRFGRNPNTGGAFPTDTQLVKAQQSVHHDRVRPSHIVLSVLGQ